MPQETTGDGAPKTAVRTFRELLIWQKAILLAKQVYELSRSFPPDERFGLTSQIRRAVVSVSSNIAEGHSRQGREFAHFLSIARGSLAEVESQLYLAAELGFTNTTALDSLLAVASEIHRMTATLVGKLS